MFKYKITSLIILSLLFLAACTNNTIDSDQITKNDLKSPCPSLVELNNGRLAKVNNQYFFVNYKTDSINDGWDRWPSGKINIPNRFLGMLCYKGAKTGENIGWVYCDNSVYGIKIEINEYGTIKSKKEVWISYAFDVNQAKEESIPEELLKPTWHNLDGKIIEGTEGYILKNTSLANHDCKIQDIKD